MNKIIYLGTTQKCSACKCQKNLLETAIEDYKDIQLIDADYKELPEWLQINISFTDFPVTIFVKDNVIKHHFVGTLSVNKIKKLIGSIDF